jgi:hypothetical protein
VGGVVVVVVVLVVVVVVLVVVDGAGWVVVVGVGFPPGGAHAARALTPAAPRPHCRTFRRGISFMRARTLVR